jgi:hypothetical protein
MTEITFNCEKINVNYINDGNLKLNYIFPYDENKTIYDYMKELKLIYDKLNTIEKSKLTHIYESFFLDYTVIDSDSDIVPQKIPLKNFRNYSFILGPAWSSPGRNEIIEHIKYYINKLNNLKFDFNFKNLQGKGKEEKMITVIINENFKTNILISNKVTFKDLIIKYRKIIPRDIPLPACPLFLYLESTTLFNSQGIPGDLTLSEANIDDSHIFNLKEICFTDINLEYYENKLIEDLKKINFYKKKINKNFNYLN